MKILIAVPAYNEEESLRNTLDDLVRHNFGYDIILIDNGSLDNTVKICRDLGVNTIAHCVNSGGSGGTDKTYFLYAYRNNYDILCQFDGDGQHIASELAKIIEPIQNDEADYVIGSRFLEKEGFQSYFVRRIGINLFASLNSIIAKQRITDPTSGFRSYNRKVIEFFGKYYKHEIYDPIQVFLLSYFLGARIREVPIKMQERKYGQSEYHVFNAITFPLKGIINTLGCLLQREQIRRLGDSN